MADDKRTTLWGNPIYTEPEKLSAGAEIEMLKANLGTCYTVILMHLTRLGLLVGADQQDAVHRLIDGVKMDAESIKLIK